MKISLGLFCLALVGLSCRSFQSESESKFDSAEHKLLGDQGYKAACGTSTAICPNTIVRKKGDKSFTYGELVAFSGDFYGKWEDIYAATSDAYPFPGGLLSSWDKVKTLKELVSREETAIEELKRNPKAAYPDFNINFTLAFGASYLELQTNNTTHFGWHNIKTYIIHHTRALELAVAASKAKDAAQKRELLTQALFANGFSDHFLTDGFAAGHIRMPRAQSLAWGPRQVKGYSAQGMGILAKVIHDNDPCVYKPGIENVCRGEPGTHLEHGVLKVENARHDKWTTRADGDLYRGSDGSEIHVRIPIQAVEASVKEVLRAYASGMMPEGVFAATEFVPFVRRDEIPLSDGFGHAFSIVETSNLLNSVGLLGSKAGRITTGLVDSNRTLDYFKALPEIMKTFREDVKKDIQTNPALTERLPPAYLDGYLNVR